MERKKKMLLVSFHGSRSSPAISCGLQETRTVKRTKMKKQQRTGERVMEGVRTDTLKQKRKKKRKKNLTKTSSIFCW